MKTLITILIAACVGVSTGASAQSNRAAITARYGLNTQGVSAVLHFNERSAVEGLYTMSHDKNRVLGTAFYQEYFSIGNSGNLQYYAGIGLHAGYTKYVEMVEPGKFSRLIQTPTEVTKKKFLGGADVIVGINYKFGGSPIMIGLDVKPNMDFINSGSMLVDGGIRLGIAF